MYVCMYVCMYVRIYVCICMYTYIRMYVFMQCMYVRIYVCMYVCMYVRKTLCTYVCMCKHKLNALFQEVIESDPRYKAVTPDSDREKLFREFVASIGKVHHQISSNPNLTVLFADQRGGQP